MARRNLTSEKRSFGKNPKTFLDKVSDAPIDIKIKDGANPEYTVTVDPRTAQVLNKDSLPGSVSTSSSRSNTPTEREEIQQQ